MLFAVLLVIAVVVGVERLTVGGGTDTALPPPSPTAHYAAPSSPAPSPAPPSRAGGLPEAPLSEAGPGDVRDLQPPLRHAVLAAIYAAHAAGVPLDVNSGFRTPQHQEELYQQAIAKYGSAQAAHAWVLPPDESDHVTGNAVDVEPAAGIAWLEANGVRFGLCRKYANEDWHFELLAPDIGQGCPAMLPHA